MTDVLYVTHSGTGATNTNLYTLNPGDMTTTLVGDTGHLFTGIAFDPTDGTMYGVTGNQGSNQKTLFTIDKLTGAATLIGGGTTVFADICFDSAGVLYGWSPAGAAAGVRNRLSVIDKATAAVTTFVVTSGTGSTFGCGMSCDGSNVLWLFATGSASDVYTVDRTTGLATNVGFCFPTLGAHDSTVGAASFGPAGALYGLATAASSTLFTAAPPSGGSLALTSLGQLPAGDLWDGLAWGTGGTAPQALEGVCIAFDDAALTADPVWTRID